MQKNLEFLELLDKGEKALQDCRLDLGMLGVILNRNYLCTATYYERLRKKRGLMIDNSITRNI